MHLVEEFQMRSAASTSLAFMLVKAFVLSVKEVVAPHQFLVVKSLVGGKIFYFDMVVCCMVSDIALFLNSQPPFR